MAEKIKANIENTQKSPLWRIKYRPKTLEQIKPYYPTIYEQFKGYLDRKTIPHLMFVGPTGSGKTMLAEILARELLQSDFDMNYRLLFADDGITTEERKETRKKGYTSTSKVGSAAGTQRTLRPFIEMRVRPFVSMRKFGSSPFKILTVKNFHDLDVEQEAFRRIMEHYANNCRMILITDKISGIIDPIVSRCQIIMVPYVPDHLFNIFIKSVCDEEDIPIKLDIIETLRKITDNNVGRALDLIQFTFLKYNFITLDHLTKIAKNMDDESVKQLFIKTIKGSFNSVRKSLRQIFWKEHKSKEQIFLELSQVIVKLPLERHVRAKYLEIIAKNDFGSLDSKDDEIQVLKLLAEMYAIGGTV